MAQTWVGETPRRADLGRGPGDGPQALAASSELECGPLLLCWVGDLVLPPGPCDEAAPALTWRFSPGCGGADGLRAPAELTGRLRLAAHLCAADSRRQDNQVPITSLPCRSLHRPDQLFVCVTCGILLASALHPRNGRPRISESYPPLPQAPPPHVGSSASDLPPSLSPGRRGPRSLICKRTSAPSVCPRPGGHVVYSLI